MTQTVDIRGLPSVVSLPEALQRDLRSDHAGETGAVFIYRGILALSRDPTVRQFAEGHLQTEQVHLQAFEDWLEPSQKSRLIVLWRVFGWTLGALSVLGGAHGVFLTIDAVERFVVQHYQEQLDYIEARLQQTDPAKSADSHSDSPTEQHHQWQAVQELLNRFMQDEDHHREDAAGRAEREPGLLGKLWSEIVGRGSAQAVSVSRAL